jgi:hypothetical protein
LAEGRSLGLRKGLIAHPILLEPVKMGGKDDLPKLVEGFEILIKRRALGRIRQQLWMATTQHAHQHPLTTRYMGCQVKWPNAVVAAEGIDHIGAVLERCTKG